MYQHSRFRSHPRAGEERPWWRSTSPKRANTERWEKSLMSHQESLNLRIKLLCFSWNNDFELPKSHSPYRIQCYPQINTTERRKITNKRRPRINTVFNQTNAGLIRGLCTIVNINLVRRGESYNSISKALQLNSWSALLSNLIYGQLQSINTFNVWRVSIISKSGKHHYIKNINVLYVITSYGALKSMIFFSIF